MTIEKGAGPSAGDDETPAILLQVRHYSCGRPIGSTEVCTGQLRLADEVDVVGFNDQVPLTTRSATIANVRCHSGRSTAKKTGLAKKEQVQTTVAHETETRKWDCPQRERGGVKMWERNYGVNTSNSVKRSK
jgi:hypothetical protein